MQKLCLRFLVAIASFATTVQALAWEAPALASPDNARLAGSLGAAQARSCDRLRAAPLNKPDFILDDVFLNQHRKFAEYSGDISGRWIDVAAFLRPQYPKDFNEFGTIMAGIEVCQKEDGHFGADQQLQKIERHRDMPILWGNGRLLIGLVEVSERTGDRHALAVARKLGDYFIATDPVYDKIENIQKIGGAYADGFATCYFSGIESLTGLGRVTRDRRYVNEAGRIAELALTVTNFDGLHSHGRLCAARGFADLYGLTQEDHWRQAAERDWAIFTEQYLLPTGGFKESLSPRCQRDEGCAEADWLRLNLALGRLTGQGRFWDAAERCLNNHFIYQQFPDGGAGHRLFHQIDGKPVAFNGLSEEAWWCCCEHWPRALVDVARTAITSDNRSIFINLAIDCNSVVNGPGGRWKAELRRTKGGLDIRLEAPQPVHAQVRIHRPAWATAGAVHAPKEYSIHTDGDTWLLEGDWHGSQHIQVSLPAPIHCQNTGSNSSVLLSGNNLLVAPDVPANAWLSDKPPSVRPLILWSPELSERNGKVVVAASLLGDANTDCPADWRPLELYPMRLQAAMPNHQFAWFSFRSRRVDIKTINTLLTEVNLKTVRACLKNR